MPYAFNKGVRLWYDTAGNTGSPVVLVMGFGGRGVFWEPQIRGLGERHALLWFDNRGVGQSDSSWRGMNTREMATDVIALMDHVGWKSAHIVGMSMGGMIAQELALGFRDRVRSLSLLATTPFGSRVGLTRPVVLTYLLGAFVGTRRKRLQAASRLLFPERFLTSNKNNILQSVFRREFDPKLTFKGGLAQLMAIMGHYTEKRLSELSGVPTLIVWGKEDLLVHTRESERMAAKIPGAKTLCFGDAGHGLNWQHPDEINKNLIQHQEEADELWQERG